jgi:hypothetical protein
MRGERETGAEGGRGRRKEGKRGLVPLCGREKEQKRGQMASPPGDKAPYCVDNGEGGTLSGCRHTTILVWGAPRRGSEKMVYFSPFRSPHRQLRALSSFSHNNLRQDVLSFSACKVGHR